MLVTPILIASLSIVTASAKAVGPRANALTNIDAIMRRQTTADCTTLCNAVNSQQQACGTSVSCVCNDQFGQLLLQCANCQEAQDPSSASELQAELNQYISGCAVGGATLGPYTVSGFSTTGPATASRTSSTRSVSGASTTGSASQSTPTDTSIPSTSVPAFATSALGSIVPSSTTSAGAGGLGGGAVSAFSTSFGAVGAGLVAAAVGIVVGAL